MLSSPPSARRPTAVALAVATSAIVLAACSGTATDPPGNAETDRIARVVADAISYPRQDDSDGLVRAALATNAGEDGRLMVIVAEDLDPEELTDPLAHLVFRVHLDGAESGFAAQPPVTACYDAEFNYHGIVDEPRRIGCPGGVPEPIVPPPAREPVPIVRTGHDVEVAGAGGHGRRQDVEHRGSDPCGPGEGMRPKLALKPTSPLNDAGMRIDPPPSLAVAIGTTPAPTAAALPPLEPPGVQVVSRAAIDRPPRPERVRAPARPPRRRRTCPGRGRPVLVLRAIVDSDRPNPIPNVPLPPPELYDRVSPGPRPRMGRAGIGMDNVAAPVNAWDAKLSPRHRTAPPPSGADRVGAVILGSSCPVRAA